MCATRRLAKTGYYAHRIGYIKDSALAKDEVEC